MQKVTSRQIFFIIFTIIVGGVNIANIPAQIGDSCGWIAIVISAGFVLLPLLAWIWLGLHSPELPMRDYGKEIVGKPLGWVINKFYAIYFALTLATFTRTCAIIIRAEYLPRTPLWAIVFALILVFSYAGSKGLTNQARILEFWGLLVLIAIVIITSIMLTAGSTLNILPLVETQNMGEYFNSANLVSSSFFGIAILNIIPLSKEKHRYTAPIMGLLCGAVVFILSSISTFAILGVSEAKTYSSPLFAAIRETRAPYLQLVSRMDFIFIACWLFAVLAVGTIIKHAIDVNIKYARTTYWSALAAFMIAVFVPLDTVLINTLGVIAAVVIPVLLLIIAKLRRWLHAIIAVVLCISLTGCWDALDIQERNIVLSMLADYNQNSYELVTEIAAVRGLEAELEARSSHLRASGESWNDAAENLNRVSDYQLHLASMYALIIGDGLSDNSDAFGIFLNKIRADDRYRKSVFMFTTDEPNVADLVELEAEHSLFIGTSIEKTMESSPRSGRDIGVRMQDILQSVSAGNPHFVLPIVSISHGQTQIGDYAIFKNLQRVGSLSSSDKNGLLFLRASKATAIYEIDGFHVEATLKNRQIIARYDGFDIRLVVDAKILYANDSLEEPNTEQLQQRLETQIMRDINTEIYRAQHWYGCDYLDFWRVYKAEFGSSFDDLDWDKVFVDMDMEVSVDARIDR